MRAATLLLVLAAGCTNYRTQIMVGILSDFVIPTDLPNTASKGFLFRFTAAEKGVPLFQPRSKCITTDAEIPGSIAIYSGRPIDTEIELSLEAYQVGDDGCKDPNGNSAEPPFATRTSALTILGEQTLFYRMALVSNCKGKICGADESCVEGRCRSRRVDSTTFPRYVVTKPLMEETVQCDSGTNYLNSSTGLNVPRREPFGCDADEECIEATCYKRPLTDAGVPTDDLALPPLADLSSGCVPTSCAAIGATCGTRADGCGGVLACGPPCQVGMFSSAGTLAPPRTAFAVLQTPRRIFLFGGEDNTLKATASVHQIDINLDGTLGAFADSGVVLSRPRESVAATFVGPFVYVTGGETNDAVEVPQSTDVVERATLDVNGTLGPFESMSFLTVRRDSHVAVVVGRYFYVLGGEDSNLAPLRSIERALINADGSLGPFMPAGTLQTPRVAAAGVVTPNFLYIIGGSGGKDRQLDTVERAAIGGDGILGPFSDAGLRLRSARGGSGLVVLGNDVYLLGGRSVGPDGGASGRFVGSIEQSTIEASGELSPFSSLGISLGGARGGHGVAASGNALFVIGGITEGPAILDSIERAALQ